MCRSIKTLRSDTQAPTREETYAAALQFVRKISGYRKPSLANTAVFNAAVEDISAASLKLLHDLKPHNGAAARVRPAMIRPHQERQPERRE